MDPTFSSSSRGSEGRTLVGHQEYGSVGGRGKENHDPGALEAAPFNLLTWLRLHGVDLVTLAVIGALCLVVHVVDPAPTRYFPILNLDGSVVHPEYALPRKKQIIPVWASALIAIFVPVLAFSLAQIRRKSIDDFLTTTMGVLKSVTTAAFLQVVIKTLIGGLRPHFYDACQPDLSIVRPALAYASSLYSPPTSSTSSPPTLIPMFDRSICRGDKTHINDALETMPSGHACAAWAGLFFLSLYINGQLKVVGGCNPAYWKMILLFVPLLGASLLSGYLVTDAHHHASDIIVGGLIGIAAALVSFRQTFASLTDFRFNHILLPRATSLFHRTPHLPVRSTGSTVTPTGRGAWFTYEPLEAFLPRDLPVGREGGWGYGRGAGAGSFGAPGDASACAYAFRGRGYGGYAKEGVDAV
ncbi:lipid phosphate phosphatase 1 [Ephemerocybe angulata]|uniref:Lipid phosphate phosphatase 1 n=1 Tax=Ephemerocybe angulata TaxID=980116 RepID=A0A8H6HZD8_9AGAR|nr:lipid phosphate phosphatase 1 [Tulosesus angulatus]